MQRLIRNTGLFSLMLLMLLKVLAVPVICIHYQLNKAFIAANLCENKAKPVLKCNGKCHLRKQLAKTTDTPESTNEKTNPSSVTVDYCEALEAVAFGVESHTITSFHAYQVAAFAIGFPGAIDHPPAV